MFNFSRRALLKGLIASIIAPPIVEEVAKGRSFISLYSPKIIIPDESTIIAMELDRVYRKLPTLFDRDDVFYSTISHYKPTDDLNLTMPMTFNLDDKY